MARFSVGDIEQLLFAAYPEGDALPGDRFGLLAGDRRTIVTRIAVALDATVPMIEAAASANCNLLVSHHPAFWNAPDSFLATRSQASSSGAAIYAAARCGIALLALHTNLDCAPSAAALLLAPLGLERTGLLHPHGSGSLGWLAQPMAEKGFISLGELARACQQAFGGVAKVWGDPARPIFTAAVCSGGASEVVGDVVRAAPDVFLTGELRHHEALWLADEGIALIELGHDLSELPYRYELRDALVTGGFDYGDIVILEPSATWWQVS
ncbi:MAG: Nif3-like dinuclear metal center hexameric protein [Coriobacteriales bacterium]|jgi:putative NIF3 family GTP cyclohydrolase 1 type 2|nr:Nif3-like dinuclear metal center hexameric protein [Coriobacteriales bacterium]